MIDRLINDSIFLRSIKDDDFEELIPEKLNSLFDNTTHKDCINRIYQLYEGKYPEISIQMIKDLHCIGSVKLMDILVLLYFSKNKDDIINELNPDVLLVYKIIKVNPGLLNCQLIPTIIRFGLLDLLKAQNHELSESNLLDACLYGHLEIVEYIFSLNTNIRYKDSCYRNACRSGNLKLVKWVWKNILLENIELFNDILTCQYVFGMVCAWKHLDLVKYLWELSFQDGFNRFSMNSVIYYSLTNISDKLNLTKVLYENSLQFTVGKSEFYKFLHESVEFSCEDEVLRMLENLKTSSL